MGAPWMTTDESRAQTRKIAFSIAVLFVLLLNGPTLYSFALEKVTPRSEIPYDEILPLSDSNGLALTLDYSFASGPIKQYVSGLSALYYDLGSIQKDARDLRIRVLKNESVVLGSNITILPWITDAKTGRIAAWMVPLVFLVDPQGEVRASYPSGNIPFRFVSGYPPLSTEVTDALNTGRLAFTYNIPAEPTSVGTWMIVILFADYIPGAPSTSFVAGTKTWFEVVKAVKPLWDSPIDMVRTFLSMWVAPGATAFAVLSIDQTRRLAVLLARNWVFIVGIVALFIAFYMSYLAP